MRLPTVQGMIRRRILVNFRVDPQAIQQHLPPRLRPKLQAGYAVAGICLVRLEHLRPTRLPALVGVSSENAAHRIAVLWEDKQGVTREGVFIPRRDTNSPLNLLLGGRLFPGKHHKAVFRIHESPRVIHLAMKAEDAAVAIDVAGSITDALPQASIFPSLAATSAFFEAGSLGYSVTAQAHRLDGLLLHTKGWRVEPLNIHTVYSSYFADRTRFPRGSVEFDHALIMRNIAHSWRAAADLYV